MNRIRIRGNDGKWYWYNPNTKRLFRSRTGMDEVKNFTYKGGNLTIISGPFAGDKGDRNPTDPFGGDRGDRGEPSPYFPHPDDPNEDPRDPIDPYRPPDDRDPDEEPEEPDDDDDEEEEPDDEYTSEEARADIIDAITDALGLIFTDAEIEEIVNEILEPVLMGELSDNDIIRLIRNTNVHKTKFPGFLDRIANGHAGMTEFEYLQMKDEANDIFSTFMGKKLSSDDFGLMFAKDTSLKEFERRLQIGKEVEEIGGPIRDFVLEESGINFSDEDLAEYLSDYISTPEFDRVIEDAYYKRYLWHMGVQRDVTDDMVKDLRGRGISVPEAMKRYEQLAQSMPGIDRVYRIDAAIAGDQETDLQSFNHAFRAFGLLDPEAQMSIGQSFAREVARFRKGGGAAFQGTRAMGLLSRSER